MKASRRLRCLWFLLCAIALAASSASAYEVEIVIKLDREGMEEEITRIKGVDKAALAVLKEGYLLEEDGVYLKRKDGKTVNLRVIDNHFHLFYFDEDLRLTKPTEREANLRYEYIRGDQEGRVNLDLSQSGMYLTSPRYIRPPLDFWVRLVSITPDGKDNIAYNRTRYDRKKSEEQIAAEEDQ